MSKEHVVILFTLQIFISGSTTLVLFGASTSFYKARACIYYFPSSLDTEERSDESCNHLHQAAKKKNLLY